MTRKDIRRIKEGDTIYDSTGWAQDVFEVQKDGVVTICCRENYAGYFSENKFYTFDDLLGDEYMLIQE